MLFVLFAISVLVVPDLLRHAGRRPGRAHRRPQRRPADAEAVRHDFGLDRPLPVQYVLMMKKLFITPRPHLVREPRREGDPADHQAAIPVTLSLVFGAAVIWVIFSIAHGPRRGRLPRHADRLGGDDPRPDRHLDAGLLARRGGQPRHPEPLPRHVLLLVGAAARLHPVHALAGGLVQGAAPAVDHPLDPLHRHLRARAPLEPGRGAGARTTSAPRAPRG